jgi:hypothetical protein
MLINLQANIINIVPWREENPGNTMHV